MEDPHSSAGAMCEKCLHECVKVKGVNDWNGDGGRRSFRIRVAAPRRGGIFFKHTYTHTIQSDSCHPALKVSYDFSHTRFCSFRKSKTIRPASAIVS